MHTAGSDRKITGLVPVAEPGIVRPDDQWPFGKAVPLAGRLRRRGPDLRSQKLRDPFHRRDFFYFDYTWQGEYDSLSERCDRRITEYAGEEDIQLIKIRPEARGKPARRTISALRLPRVGIAAAIQRADRSS